MRFSPPMFDPYLLISFACICISTLFDQLSLLDNFNFNMYPCNPFSNFSPANIDSVNIDSVNSSPLNFYFSNDAATHFLRNNMLCERIEIRYNYLCYSRFLFFKISILSGGGLTILCSKFLYFLQNSSTFFFRSFLDGGFLKIKSFFVCSWDFPYLCLILIYLSVLHASVSVHYSTSSAF